MKFKQTVIQRKFHRHSMSTFEQNSVIMGRITHSNDDTRPNFQKKILDHHNRNTVKAWRGKRGSKTTEELLELQLPITKRDSLMANFETDDDIRKRLKKQKLQKQQSQSIQEADNEEDDDDDSDDYKDQ